MDVPTDASWYSDALYQLATGALSWERETFVAALLTDRYAPSYANDRYFVEVEPYEVNAYNYTRLTLSGCTVVQEYCAIFGKTDTPIEWYNLDVRAGGDPIKYIVIYCDRGDPALSPLVLGTRIAWSCMMIDQIKYGRSVWKIAAASCF